MSCIFSSLLLVYKILLHGRGRRGPFSQKRKKEKKEMPSLFEYSKRKKRMLHQIIEYPKDQSSNVKKVYNLISSKALSLVKTIE
jgi:hypothetical protein